MNMKPMAVVLCIALMWAGSAAAGSDGPVGLQAILQQQHSLAADLDAGKVGNLKAPQVEEIRKAQRQIFNATEGKADLDALESDQRAMVMNRVDKIKAIVAAANAEDSEKLICKRERVSGSLTTRKTCATQEERDQQRKLYLEDVEKRRICEPPCWRT